jgi:hypothetical protein
VLLLLLRFTISINVFGCAGILRLVVKENCGGEVVERLEKSELDLAPNASEASNQFRRSPNSRNEAIGPFGIDIKSAM